MKIKFELDDDFPLDKTFSISNMIIAAVSVLGKSGKYYPQFFYMNAHISYKNVTVPKN